MNRETAVRKILRCLRLAASSNPNEAATALRQARSMMDMHGLTEADAYASEIHEADAPTRCRGATPTRSLMYLISVIEDGFRCASVIVRAVGLRGEGRTTIRFYGAGSEAQIAAYAFTVLRRQLEADKAKHTARIRKRVNKESRGEAFALGWVCAIARQFPKAEISDDRVVAIETKKALLGEMSKVSGREIAKAGASSTHDRVAGYYAGSRARVNAGLGESAQRKLESQA